MIPYLRYGVDISRHHLKGTYVCTIGKSARQSPSPTVRITCTTRETHSGDLSAGDPKEPGGAGYSPIALSYQGVHTILRPWNPYTCVIAAGVQSGLLYFPIRPRGRIVVLGCSLQTLSHLADILGKAGLLIGVIPADDPNPPTKEELSAFLMRHPQVWVVTEEIENASLERYELLLSLPMECKYAFLMALHPRLGAQSPAHALAGADRKQSILRKIFEFLEFPDAAKATCLVMCYCTPDTRVDVIRDIVSNHVNILKRWHVPGRVAKEGEEGGGSDSGGSDQKGLDPEEKNGQGKPKKSKESDDRKGLRWVLLDLPIGQSPDMESNLAEVVDDMKRLSNGLRTGLRAKEQLILTPYFPNHALLLVKYVPHRDERGGQLTARKKAPPIAPAGIEDQSSTAEGSEARASRMATPASSSLPVPKFNLGGRAPGLAGAGRAPPAPPEALPGSASRFSRAPADQVPQRTQSAAAQAASHGKGAGAPQGPGMAVPERWQQPSHRSSGDPRQHMQSQSDEQYAFAQPPWQSHGNARITTGPPGLAGHGGCGQDPPWPGGGAGPWHGAPPPPPPAAHGWGPHGSHGSGMPPPWGGRGGSDGRGGYGEPPGAPGMGGHAAGHWGGGPPGADLGGAPTADLGGWGTGPGQHPPAGYPFGMQPGWARGPGGPRGGPKGGMPRPQGYERQAPQQYYDQYHMGGDGQQPHPPARGMIF